MWMISHEQAGSSRYCTCMVKLKKNEKYNWWEPGIWTRWVGIKERWSLWKRFPASASHSFGLVKLCQWLNRDGAFGRKADIFIVIGTSLNVIRLPGLYIMWKKKSLFTWSIPTQRWFVGIQNLTIFHEPAGTGVPKLVDQLLKSVV